MVKTKFNKLNRLSEKAEIGMSYPIYQKLDEEQRSELEKLLDKYVTVKKFAEEDKIKFKVTNIEKLKSEGYVIHIVDNINNYASLFIPTYRYAVDDVGEECEVYIKGCRYYGRIKNTKDNRIVSSWACKEIWGSPVGGAEYPATIWLYSPESYINNNGISMNFYYC